MTRVLQRARLRRASPPPKPVPGPALPRRGGGPTDPGHGSPVGDALEAFREYLGRAGLKSTRQRDAIVRAFLASGRHLTVWQLHQQVVQEDPRVNVATVFRTLKLLCRAGLAVERRFAHSLTRFEPAPRQAHHHMICTQCGGIEEFQDEGLEGIQAGVARRAGFDLAEGRIELYGTCRACRREPRGDRRRRRS